ncbi:penicillin-binding protein 2 [Bifidobacterium sp. SMB2]|uniref:Penicillin-binding protein 2 n=1 Tax=Bifidobacterium saimiriisciurei TaxID=2661627 RepID=A0ABX0CC17_9BIFI|nr:penicillin-binding protein 2 [Bifidobacterium saimiriisciurei]NEG95962.1 penicillin-binding protein 2 [Bifidobacterium sp. SMB2]NEH11809.1 penicillin-binding protein 2 [Bifidobacterium saimiriisciurei]
MNRKAQRSQGDIFRRRALVIGIVLALLASACIARLSYIQLFSAESMAQAATASRTVTKPLQSQRGTIVDTNGVVLAQSVERYTVYADQKAVADFKPVDCKGDNQSVCHSIDGKNVNAEGAAAVAKLLAPVLGMNTMELGGKLVGESRYVVLKKNVVPAVKRSIDKLHLSGVINYELTSKREYSDKDGLLGGVLGGVDDSGAGVAGIEKMTNASLVGKDGSVRYQRGANGQEIPGTRTESEQPVDGGKVKLTIDWDTQWYVKKALQDAKKKTGADWGIAVVEEVKSGKIRAIADTDTYAAGSDGAKMNASKAVTTVFEPGSTGKLITAAGLLQEGLHKPTDKFQVPYQTEVNGQTYHDSHEHGLQNLTLAGILKESSNVGTVMASKNYTLKQRYDYITKFGIGQSTGLNFPGESRGQLAPYQSWDLRTRNTVLFGQGYSASALQMTNVVATIANKGVRCGQSIIESSTDADGNDTTPSANQPVRVIDESVAGELMDMMESMASQYKNVASIKGYRIAGKSGTAQVADSSGALNNHIGDFIAAIPADNPRYVVTVVLMNPDGIYGGITAGPVVATIGEFLMQKYEVPASSARKNAIPTEW